MSLTLTRDPAYTVPPQKDVIEKMMDEMLKSGIIQPSSIQFSSLILLVRKKDHSSRMCIDYRLLNDITIKYKFPILLVDERLVDMQFFQSLT